MHFAGPDAENGDILVDSSDLLFQSCHGGVLVILTSEIWSGRADTF
jgi:hypothetical protein